MAHHCSWLGDLPVVSEKLQNGELTKTPAIESQLQRGVKICQQILQQNPNSSLATTTLERINQLLSEGQKPNSTPPATESTLGLCDEDSRERLDNIVSGVETGLERIRQVINSNGSSVQSGYTPLGLAPTFDIVNRNSSNPCKNKIRIRGQSDTNRIAPLQAGQFMYDLITRGHPNFKSNSIASFDAGTFSMQLREDFNPESNIDLSIAYHEATHARQCWYLYLKMGDDAYMQFNAPENRNLILSDEVSAWAMQIEAVDRYLGGWLRSVSGEKCDESLTREFMSRMNDEECDLDVAHSLLFYSQMLFPHGYQDSKCPRAFHDELRDQYAKEGCTLFMHDSSGHPVPLV